MLRYRDPLHYTTNCSAARIGAIGGCLTRPLLILPTLLGRYSAFESTFSRWLCFILMYFLLSPLIGVVGCAVSLRHSSGPALGIDIPHAARAAGFGIILCAPMAALCFFALLFALVVYSLPGGTADRFFGYIERSSALSSNAWESRRRRYPLLYGQSDSNFVQPILARREGTLMLNLRIKRDSCLDTIVARFYSRAAISLDVLDGFHTGVTFAVVAHAFHTTLPSTDT